MDPTHPTDDPLSDREVDALTALTTGVGGLAFAGLLFVIGALHAPPVYPMTAARVLNVVAYMAAYMTLYGTLLMVSLAQLATACGLSESPPRPLRWLA